MNTKLKCLLLDDELPGLTYLKMLCEQIPELEVVKAFNNPDVFLSEIPELDFDLCILDIEMPMISGIEVANLLQGKLIIFATAYKEFALDAFELDAVDYLQKPIKKERLQMAVQKALKRIQQEIPTKKFTQLQADKGKILLYFDKINYVKTASIDSRDKEVLLNDGSTVILKNISFEKLLELLPTSDFCRINKHEIIKLSIVQFFSADLITTNCTLREKNLVLTLGNSFKKDFLSKLTL
ncbi:MAG TPA: response regulator [Flavobacterium sp.]|uniref:LytR/AlgR family response regulator transcription factor n=1 Tax=unclassified Flavobacterium TaxID=196869 RepID=UPI000E88AF36|nr:MULTISPECIES: response regulator [unclassified Flavobacterium]HBI01918.1 two-component system response regulator [Flavobacterium sp.]HRE76471.1 response regulator [Flavobacterium sp.]